MGGIRTSELSPQTMPPCIWEALPSLETQQFLIYKTLTPSALESMEDLGRQGYLSS